MKFLKESSWAQEVKYFSPSATKKLEAIFKAGLFDEMREEIYDATNDIVESIFTDEYRLETNMLRDYETGFLSEEDRKNAIKTMYSIINKYYRQIDQKRF